MLLQKAGLQSWIASAFFWFKLEIYIDIQYNIQNKSVQSVVTEHSATIW
jgi:hypothetical protein